MFISKLKIHNYKIFRDISIDMNESFNIFVGENDSGKTTILESLQMSLTGKISGAQIISKLNPDWFNLEVREEYKNSLLTESYKAPPKISFEIYFDGIEDDDVAFLHYKGTNNTSKEDAVGVRLVITFNEEYSDTYKQLLNERKVIDIPVELYKVEFSSFAQQDYYVGNTSKRLICIDTTKKDYGNVLSRFVSNTITTYLSEEDETNLRLAYRGNRKDFINSDAVKNLNQKLRDEHKFGAKKLSLNLRSGEIDNWKNEMSLSIDEIPFESVGFGTQNMIKSELVFDQNRDVDFLVLEEPENNLSYTNMSILISRLSESESKQLFISTHSSYVANKLGLNNLHLVTKGKTSSLKDLSKDTFGYFAKLPGYNTLRLLLANHMILVEGPADELILQRAYMDTYGKLPIQDGIDVMSVGGVAFKRYCELTKLIGKPITVVTDNDGNADIVKERYREYSDLVTLCVEENVTLNTLEPSVLAVNRKDFDTFRSIIYHGDSKLDYQELCDFMIKNKSEWALRVFQSDKKISYPDYIKKAIGALNSEQ